MSFGAPISASGSMTASSPTCSNYWRGVKIRLVETEHKQAERDMAAAFVAVIEEVQWRREQEKSRDH